MFYRMAIGGAVLVAMGVLLSLFAEPLLILSGQKPPQISHLGLVDKLIEWGGKGSIYVVVLLLPLVLVMAGIGLPIVALIWFRDFAGNSRVRRGDSDLELALPLRAAWVLVLVEVPALILFGVLAIAIMGSPDTTNKGLNNPELYLDLPE